MTYTTLLKFDLANALEIKNVIHLLLGAHDSLVERSGYWQIIHHKSMNEAILQTVQSLESDLSCMITCYQDIYEPELIRFIETIFLEAPYDYYQFKTLLCSCPSIPTSKELLDYLLAGTGVTKDVLLAMAACDLNVSKAASILFMHRNTLLYKIDRMFQLKHFDLRCFNDLYLLIKLLKA